jgi:hypothetical protein
VGFDGLGVGEETVNAPNAEDKLDGVEVEVADTETRSGLDGLVLLGHTEAGECRLRGYGVHLFDELTILRERNLRADTLQAT